MKYIKYEKLIKIFVNTFSKIYPIKYFYKICQILTIQPLIYMETKFFHWLLRLFQPEKAKSQAQFHNHSYKNALMKLPSLPLMRFQHVPRALLLLHFQTLLPVYCQYICYYQAEIIMCMNFNRKRATIHNFYYTLIRCKMIQESYSI